MRPRRGLVPLVVVCAAIVACGKKGPPLAPLRLVPEAPAEPSVRRLGPDVHVRFTVPAKNAGAPGAVAIDRVEVYAASLASGAPAPPNREFLTARYLVGTIAVRPPAEEGEPPADPALAETRPSPGDVATFVEPLTTEMLNPVAPPTPATPPAAEPAAPAAAPSAAAPAYPVRIYAVRGITRSGRPGAPSGRLSVPLVAPPPAPASVSTSFTAAAFAISWVPPVAEVGAPAILFNVYKAEAPAVPLNASPLAAPAFERAGVAFGTEQCFAVRTATAIAGVSIESEPSAPSCVTPRDVFPPAAPAGLNGVSTAGVVALIWDANTEPDLAGYLVLRGEASGDTLQPVTREPIAATAYRDTTVQPGVRYVYVIVAVDRATPPNTSAHSARVEVTAAQ